MKHTDRDINAEWAPNQADPEPTYDDFKADAAAKGLTREESAHCSRRGCWRLLADHHLCEGLS